MIDAILFDLGDTIINFGIDRKAAEVIFHHGARESYDYLQSHGKPVSGFDRYCRVHHRKMRNEYIWSKFIRRDFSYADVLFQTARYLRIPLETNEIHELAWRWYLPYIGPSSIDPGVHDMLAELRAAGTKLGIVSNTLVPDYCLDRHLAQTGLLEFFPVRVYSSHTGYRKPHRRIFEIALSQIGVTPDRAIFIGDVPSSDIRGAHNAGMKTIWKPAAKNPASPPRRHQADGTIAKITLLLNVLPALGWRANPTKASPVVEPALSLDAV